MKYIYTSVKSDKSKNHRTHTYTWTRRRVQTPIEDDDDCVVFWSLHTLHQKYLKNNFQFMQVCFALAGHYNYRLSYYVVWFQQWRVYCVASRFFTILHFLQFFVCASFAVYALLYVWKSITKLIATKRNHVHVLTCISNLKPLGRNKRRKGNKPKQILIICILIFVIEVWRWSRDTAAHDLQSFDSKFECVIVLIYLKIYDSLWS